MPECPAIARKGPAKPFKCVGNTSPCLAPGSCLIRATRGKRAWIGYGCPACALQAKLYHKPGVKVDVYMIPS